MPSPPLSHPLGRIDQLSLERRTAFVEDVPLEHRAIQRAWPRFEARFDSLRGRRFLGLVDEANERYRLCSLRLARDTEPPDGLVEAMVPGGVYLRLRLDGEPPPEVYRHIGSAFEVLLERARLDPSRPLIEDYRSAHRIDCLLPVLGPAAAPEAARP